MKKVPNLRFKEFSGEWESRPLSELGIFFKGGGLSKADLSDEGSPCVLYGELYTKYTEVIGNVQSKTNVVLDNAVLGKVNDVLIPSSGETAIDIATASCLQQDDVILGGDLNVFRSNKINGIFTSYQLNTSKKFEISKLAQGASVVHVYNDQLKKLRLSIPTIQEQEKIAAFFSLIDKKIELQTEKVEELKNYKKGFMQKIFPRKGELVPELRFVGFTNDWEECKLEKVTKLITKGTTPKDKSWIGPVNYIKTESIDKDSGSLTRTASTSLEEHEGYLKRSQLQNNDVLFSIVGTLGRVGLVGLKDLPANTNQQIAIIRTDELNPYFLMNILKSPKVKSFIESDSTVGAQPSLSLWQINELKICVPSIAEQQKIGHYFFNLDKLITLHQCKLDALNEYKKGLLQQMFI